MPNLQVTLIDPPQEPEPRPVSAVKKRSGCSLRTSLLLMILVALVIAALGVILPVLNLGSLLGGLVVQVVPTSTMTPVPTAETGAVQ